MTGAANFPWRNAAVALVAVFLVGFAAQLALVTFGGGNLETVVQPSAVGDSSYFQVPENLVEGTALATFEGRTLVAAALKPEKAASVSMIRVGPDDSGAFDVYQAGEGADAELQGFYFLKSGPRRFLRVRPQESGAQ